MKTKLIILLTGLVLSLNIKANNISDVLPTEVLKSSIKEVIELECNKWDYTGLNKKVSEAKVAFRVSSNGAIVIDEIATTDKDFKQLITENLPKIKLTQELNSSEVFYISLKHKTA